MEPKPANRWCQWCLSKQVVEHREIKNSMVILKLHCKACRRDLIFWTGSRVEERAFKRSRTRVQRMIAAAARQLPGSGDGGS